MSLPLCTVSACDFSDRAATECASATDLTASIGGQVYRIPASARAAVEAAVSGDVFAVAPGTYDGPEPHLLECQRKDKVPVRLQGLTLADPAAGPSVVQLSIDHEQREAVSLPALSVALSTKWIALGPKQGRELRFSLGRSGQVLRSSCEPEGTTDFRGRPRVLLCDLRVKLEPQGVLRLQFRRPSDPRDTREILVRTDEYP